MPEYVANVFQGCVIYAGVEFCRGSFLSQKLSLVSRPQHAHSVEGTRRGMSGMQSRWRNSHATLENYIKPTYLWHFWGSSFEVCSGSFLCKMLALVSGPQHAHSVEGKERGMSGMHNRWCNTINTIRVEEAYSKLCIQSLLSAQLHPQAALAISSEHSPKRTCRIDRYMYRKIPSTTRHFPTEPA